jgi:exodeoxyribonuclease VII large subunit
MEDKYLTISALNKYIKYKFDVDDHLKNIFLRGEISNLKPHTTGHYYFTLKDETSKISAVMFKNSTLRLTFKPEDGMKVLITGKVGVYEAAGSYQVYIDDMQEDGVGNLHIAFEKLKEQLSKEGLFDPKYKKKIPKIPSKIGIITAPNGAAIKDILTTLKRRFKNVETITFPCLVQGNDAKDDIVNKIKLAQNYDLDVIILGRGGGSIEDLWAFNEEVVARAIFDSKVPIISAVGHEIDYTISDFVADLRAPTPTAAAELAVPNYIEIINQINNYKIRTSKVLLNIILNKKEILKRLSEHYILKNPMNLYQNKQIQIDNNIYKLTNLINITLKQKKEYFNNLKNNYIFKNPYKLLEPKLNIYNNKIDKLSLLNPLNTLKRGYTIVKYNSKAISNIKLLNINDTINVLFDNGLLEAKITNIKENV